eukprot:9191747-Heterocapsa_arctica.AAC.1
MEKERILEAQEQDDFDTSDVWHMKYLETNQRVSCSMEHEKEKFGAAKILASATSALRLESSGRREGRPALSLAHRRGREWEFLGVVVNWYTTQEGQRRAHHPGGDVVTLLERCRYVHLGSTT